MALAYRAAHGELTGFFPRIDQIFPSATSKQKQNLKIWRYHLPMVVNERNWMALARIGLI